MKKLLPALIFSGCNFLNPTLPVCGDNIIDRVEECDDGNQIPGDHCSASCTVETCGNGAIDPGEECDDQNLEQLDSCHNDCSLSGCGDGVVDADIVCFDPPSPINIGDAVLTVDFLGVSVPGTMRFGKLNDDEFLDYIIAAPGSGALVVGLGNGNGLFQNSISTPLQQAVGIVLEDVTGDEVLDAIVSRPLAGNGGDVVIAEGVGDGTFVSNDTLLSGNNPLALGVSDLDQDGDKDIVILSTVTIFLIDFTDFLTVFLFDEPTGNFVEQPRVPLNEDLNSTDLTIADMDDNGELDLISADSARNTVSIIRQDDLGGFGNLVSVAQPNQNTTFGVAVGDLNSDGLLDFVAADTTPGNLTVNINQSANPGTFSSDVLAVAGIDGVQRVVADDLDEDGDLDLVATLNDPRLDIAQDVFIYLNNGDGSFSAPAIFSAGVGSFDIFVGDLNGDQAKDIAVQNVKSNDISIFLANP